MPTHLSLILNLPLFFLILLLSTLLSGTCLAQTDPAPLPPPRLDETLQVPMPPAGLDFPPQRPGADAKAREAERAAERDAEERWFKCAPNDPERYRGNEDRVAKPIREADDELTRWLKVRYNAASEEVDAMTARFEEGFELPGEDFQAATRRLLTAELELANSPEERVAAFEDYAKHMKDMAKMAAARVIAGSARSVFATRFENYWADAEIMLLREKQQIEKD